MTRLLWIASLAAASCRFEDVPPTAAAPDLPSASPAPAAPDAGPEEDAGPEAAADRADAPGASEAPKAVAVATPDSWATDPEKAPYSVHMTWEGEADTSVVFTWATAFNDVAVEVPRVIIQPKAEVEAAGQFTWGPATVFEGEGANYKESLLGVDLSNDLHVVWTVRATGLVPDTDYVWRVGFGDVSLETGELKDPNWSELGSVRTAPVKGSRAPFTFVVAGDSRGGESEIAARMDRYVAVDARFWLFTGDMTVGGTQPEWDSWMGVMQPLTTRRVLLPVQGNHEILADLYYTQFALPSHPELPEHLREHAWSLDYGNVHIVGLDSNTQVLAEEQVPWLEADLAAASADPDIDWIVAFFHHPAYSASNHGSTSWVQKNFVPAFEKFGVPLTIAGHDHNYERTVPIKGGAEVGWQEGPIHVTAGAFFAPAYSNGKKWFTAVSHHGDLRNWMILDVDGKVLKATVWSGDGGPGVPGQSPLDEFTLTRPE